MKSTNQEIVCVLAVALQISISCSHSSSLEQATSVSRSEPKRASVFTIRIEEVGTGERGWFTDTLARRHSFPLR